LREAAGVRQCGLKRRIAGCHTALCVWEVAYAENVAYRSRKGTSQALVTLTDWVTKKRRDYWLGEYATPESGEAHHRIIADWTIGGCR